VSTCVNTIFFAERVTNKALSSLRCCFCTCTYHNISQYIEEQGIKLDFQHEKMFIKGHILINNLQQFNFNQIPTHKNNIDHAWIYTSKDIQQNGILIDTYY